MKKILIPTDFSSTALGAAIYGAELAKSISAKIILFHAYHPPLPAAANEFFILPDWDLDKENMALLENFKKEIQANVSGDIEMECAVKLGFAVDEIVGAIEEMKIDFVVMGISGSGRMSEFLMGSNTTGVIQKTRIPVIVVPPKATFKKISSIVFACDYKGEISNAVIHQLKEFVHLFHSKLSVLNLEKPEEGVTIEKAIDGIQLENLLSDTFHTLHFLPKTGDIAAEINDFVSMHDSDLLVIVPHRYKLFQRIFHQSVTKHLSFHSTIPILALHE